MGKAGWPRRRTQSAPVRRSASVGGREGGFTLIELMVVILIIGILASLLLGAIWGAWRSSQLSMARLSVSDLERALQAYQTDNNVYPPGDGSGSADLVKELRKAGARQLPYLELAAERVNAAGHLRSTLDPGEIVHYRNNAGRKGDPAVHNRGRFDLWFRDLDGHADGVRNW